ncbi:MAG TPA: tellurite resistance TerB family protein [Polyangiaceae bacterium]|nr:tellurite resistance TerB family protein [Polyangiaceae bacterium]
MRPAQQSLLKKVASKLGEPPSYADEGAKGSILTLTAAIYGSMPVDEDVTRPTGFDPEAAALFEAVVESAYLVAQADGSFDAEEREAFQHVVISACEGAVAVRQVTALLADLQDQLTEDGIDKRIRMVARAIARPEHALEVLRVAALLAYASGGVSESERDVLGKLAAEFRLDQGALATVLEEVQRALLE